MKINPKLTVGALGVLAGGLIAVGLQVHAAQVQNPAPVAQVQPVTQSAVTADVASVSDPKDAPASGSTVERPDASESGAAETDANLPGGGHADPSGNVNHQFEGEE